MGRNVSACGRGGETYRRVGVSACGRVGGSAFGKRTKLLVKMGVALAKEECNTFIKNVMKHVEHCRDLDVYQGALSLVMRIFELSKHFPIEEKYTLTDQVRRSSRSVCAKFGRGRWGVVSAYRRVGVGNGALGDQRVVR